MINIVILLKVLQMIFVLVKLCKNINYLSQIFRFFLCLCFQDIGFAAKVKNGEGIYIYIIADLSPPPSSF